MADDTLQNLKLPPHSIEAEQALLGGLLIDNNATDKVADLISLSDFYRHEHKLIFDHINKVIGQDQPADIVTVSESLEKSDELASIGGLAYLASIAENTPSASNIRGYAEIIRERSIMRKLVQVGSDIAESAYSPKGRDAQKLLDESEAKVFEIADQGQRDSTGFSEINSILPQAMKKIEEIYGDDNIDGITGVPTGYSELDKLTSGLQPGELVILAGRPSMGKTALALNMAEYAAVDKKLPVAIFSMEMASMQLTMRLLGSVGKIDQHKMRTGELDEGDWEKLTHSLGVLNEAPIFIDEGAGLNSYEIRARSRRLHRQLGGLGLIVIDYLQMSRSLKALAKELNVPVLALSQLNRSVESRPDKRPFMSDLRESGAIEQDADVIMFIYRDDHYNEDSPDKGTAEIILSKQRNGPTGMVRLTFLGQYTRFENYTNPGYDQNQ